jgi:hypothetical protein
VHDAITERQVVTLADVCREVGERMRAAHLNFGTRHDDLVVLSTHVGDVGVGPLMR